ncbi:MAG: 23S rRNA (uracil(1939)-C(5))-methyltransferase RlmD [Chlamydiota bacterium]
MKKKEVIVEIQDFTSCGHGLGYYEGKPVEVRNSMPGDTVRVVLLRRRRGVIQTLLKEVVEPSSERVESPCSHYGWCGGCSWQHLPYQQQLDLKEKLIADLFAEWPQTHLGKIMACGTPWQYRNKMEFSFSSNKAGENFLGMIIGGSRGKVFNLRECHLTSEWFAEAVDLVREWWQASGLDAYHHDSDQGALRTLTIREGQRTGQHLVMLTVSGNPHYALNRQQLESFASLFDDNVSVFLRIQHIAKGTPTRFYEMHLKGPDHIEEELHIENQRLRLNIGPTSFFQPNTLQAEQLYQKGLELVGVEQDHIVYDLYCGTGTIGMVASQYAAQVVGIELHPESILDAKANLAKNNIDNVKLLQGDVGDILAQWRQDPAYKKPDIVVVDPPRAGLNPQALQQIIELAPKKLLYISCNPKTQVENIRSLNQEGYYLQVLQPVDQFPHTAHIENIAVLVR